MEPWLVSRCARLAWGPRDVDLVADWLGAFHHEATPHAPSEEWRIFAERRIAAEILLDAWQAGVLLCGVSAGMNGCFEQSAPTPTAPGNSTNAAGSCNDPIRMSCTAFRTVGPASRALS